MPSYAMSCFKLPPSLCNKIQSVLTRFWWDEKPGVRKICWVAWDKLTLPYSNGGLGFRDIEKFNDSLLAKLSWRLIMEPDSLVAKILKGKYYPTSSFMESGHHSTGSYGWTGLLAGKNVLKLGIGWIVGNGRNVLVWGDAWLSTSTPLQPFGPVTYEARSLRVSDLINPISNTWNLEIIRRHLPHYEDIITSIVLSSCSMQDTLVWLPVQSGTYTTKFGYALNKLHVEPEPLERFEWRTCVWKVKTLPKIRNFLWKLKSGALAVGSNLLSRGIRNMSKCKFCDGFENEMHIVLHCPFAGLVWDKAPVMFKLEPDVTTINQLLTSAHKQVNLPPTGLTITPLYPWILWSLWKARNQLLFENRRTSPSTLINGALREAKEWEMNQPIYCPQSSPLVATHISPLPHDAVLCFTDAAWNESSRESGIGWCFKDVSLRTFNTGSAPCRNVSSPLVAEAIAVKTALIAAKTMGIRALNVFSDSLSLVTLLNSNGVVNELKSILFDIRCIGNDFTSISFAFIPRSANVLADALAKFGIVCLNSSPFVGN